MHRKMLALLVSQGAGMQSPRPGTIDEAQILGGLVCAVHERSEPLLILTAQITQQRLAMIGLTDQAQIFFKRTHRPSPLRTFAIVAAAALFATVIAGCGGKSSQSSGSQSSGAQTPAASGTSSAGAPAAQAGQLVQDASKATTDLHSLHIVLATTNINTLPMESVDADVTNQPKGNGQAVGHATIRPTPQAKVISKDFLVTNKTMYTKNEAGVYTSMGEAKKIYDPGIILDPDKGLGFAIGKVQNPQVAGNENINGVATVKVTGTIDSAVIDPIIPQIGKGGGNLPITLYITDVKATPGGTANLVRMVVNKDQGDVTITLSAWGKPVTIPNPTP
jgi:LppX_LprAFG lipoprotein